MADSYFSKPLENVYFFLYRRGVHNQLPATPLASGHKHLSASNPTSGLALTLSAIGSPCSLTRAPSRPPLAICVRARCILTFAIGLTRYASSKGPARAAASSIVHPLLFWAFLFHRPRPSLLKHPNHNRATSSSGLIVVHISSPPQMGLCICMFNSNQVIKAPSN